MRDQISLRSALCAAVALSGAAFLSSGVHAATIQTTTADAATLGTNGNAVDGGTGVASTTINTARAGSNGGATPPGRSYVIPFQLPTLAAGLAFQGSSLRVDLAATAGFGGALGTYPNGTNATFNADLYGLGVRATSAVAATDYFQGTLDTTDAMLIQDNLITPFAVTPPDAQPVTTSGTALDTYLNIAYANGANAGKYVFLRFSADADSTTANIAYNFYTFEAGSPTIGGVVTNVIPTITYSVTPEPATLAALGSAGLLLRRRRA